MCGRGANRNGQTSSRTAKGPIQERSTDLGDVEGNVDSQETLTRKSEYERNHQRNHERHEIRNCLELGLTVETTLLMEC